MPKKMIDTLFQRYPWTKQIFKFGCVGTLAGITNYLIVVLLVETTGMRPLIANIFAFATAFNVSYFGHRNITFRGTATPHAIALPKLFTIAGVNFLLNEGLFFVFLHIFNMHYTIALLFVILIIPAISFVGSKYWVFKC